MGFMWGLTALNVIKDTDIPPYAEAEIKEIPLLPDPDNPSEASSVLQQGPTLRTRVTFEGFVYSGAEFQALLTDRLNGTSRTFTGADGFSATMLITALTPLSRQLFPLRIKYSMTLVEAS